MLVTVHSAIGQVDVNYSITARCCLSNVDGREYYKNEIVVV